VNPAPRAPADRRGPAPVQTEGPRLRFPPPPVLVASPSSVADWYEIALELPTSLVDEAAALLDIAGFGGIEQRERGERSDVVVVVETGDPAEAANRASDAVAFLGAGAPRTSALDPKIWTENWKTHFSRRSFAGRVEVRPPWESAPQDPSLVGIVINPGMAFGTGLHETTAGCLELLVEEVRPGMRVADVGCGSGILAIAAAGLGAAEVLATDVDPLAVDATRENIEANGVADRVRVELEPGEIGVPEWERDARPGLSAAREEVDDDAGVPVSGHTATRNAATSGGFAARGAGAFDLVVANILAETLIELRDVLTSSVAPGGALVLSGIEQRRLKRVEDAFIGMGWQPGRVVHKGDWVALSLRRHLAEPARGLSLPAAVPADGSLTTSKATTK
jgi:ribosomal protein L11 methyltransferase